jgi:hypothetical protein
MRNMDKKVLEMIFKSNQNPNSRTFLSNLEMLNFAWPRRRACLVCACVFIRTPTHPTLDDCSAPLLAGPFRSL